MTSSVVYRPDIQGLRAIAVVAVMVFHLNPALLPGGFIGVDVFLVISGFLITSILLKKKAQTDYSFRAALKYFYVSRFKRIAPAYFVMLVLVALIAAIFFIPEDFSTFREGLQKALYFYSNDYFAGFGDYFAPANHEQPLLHTWSLAVEIQFYLLAPLLVLLLPRLVLKWALVVFLCILTGLAEYRMRMLGLEQETYYSLYARLPEFFAGCLVALHMETSFSRKTTYQYLPGIGLLLILIAAIAQPRLGYFPGVAALLPIVGSILLLLTANQSNLSWLLSSKGLVWVGTLSYSLYIWHWPVLAFLRYYSGAEVLDGLYSSLFVVMTIVLSVASYYWIERPFRMNEKQKYKVFLYFLLALGVVSTSQSMEAVNRHYTPDALPVEYRRYADPEVICHGSIVGNCLRGDLSSSREVLVLGDSHAAMLNHFFDYLGKELNFKARIITASSCVTVPGFDYERLPKWAWQSCISQIDVAKRYLESAKTIFVAGMWTYQSESIVFKEAFLRFSEAMDDKDKRVIVLSQVPELDMNPLRTYRFRSLGFDPGMTQDHTDDDVTAATRKLLAGVEGIEFLDLGDLALFSKPPLYGHELMYFDNHHLNEVGARYYAEHAISKFREVIGSEVE
ncbi:MAG: acyltransferase family protein [Marinobacter sp.]